MPSDKYFAVDVNEKILFKPTHKCPYSGKYGPNSSTITENGYFDANVEYSFWSDDYMTLMFTSEVNYSKVNDIITIEWLNSSNYNYITIFGGGLLYSSDFRINSLKFNTSSVFHMNSNDSKEKTEGDLFISHSNTDFDQNLIQSSIIQAINLLFIEIGKATVKSEHAAGIGNNVNILEKSKTSFSGTLGNKTTSGYYINYTLFLSAFINTFDFVFSIPPINYVSTADKITYNIPLNCKYNDILKVDSNISGNYTLYIPEVTIPGYTIPFWPNDIKMPAITTPSTYSTSPTIGYDIDADVTFNNTIATIYFSFTISSYDYSKPGTTTLIRIYAPGIRRHLFLSEISISSFEIDTSDIDVDIDTLGLGLDLNLNGGEVDDITEMINPILVDLLNNLISNDNVYEFYP